MSVSHRLHAACACSVRDSFALPGTKRQYERSRPFSVTHQVLDLTVDFDTSSVSGTASLEFLRRAPHADRLQLDGVGLSVRAVSLKTGKSPAKLLTQGRDYSYDGEQFVIDVPSECAGGVVLIEYSATPKMGLYFQKPDDTISDRPIQLWSQCQDEDGRYWFPCQDKPHVKMTSEMRVRVPHGLTALSGGRLVEKRTPKRGPWTFHYSLDFPAPAYLMTLVVGRFDQWSESLELPSGREIELVFMVPPGKTADGKRAFHRTRDMIRLFSEVTGVEYPWDRYTQVVVNDFIFGGMENTTATTMYEYILLDKTAALDVESHDLVAHELAHQWFGDLVTCRDWSHAWLNEGFATYFELVEKEARTGRDEYEEAVAGDLAIYLGEAGRSYQRPIVCRDYEEPIDLFDRHLYQKGGLVLHMLRKELGDDCFWRGIHQYLDAHRDGIVETTNLVRALEEASGLSLERFFDQWVYRPGHPELDVKVSYGDGLVTVDVEQNQRSTDVAIFEMLLEVDVTCGGQTTRHRRRIDSRKSSLVVRTDARPEFVVVDPDFRIASAMKISAPRDMLLKQLREAPTARARKLAALSLARRTDPDTVHGLAACLQSSGEAWMVRAAAAQGLAKIGGEQARAHLLEEVAVDHPKVRRAVAQALGHFRDEDVVKALIRLTKDESYLVTASAARSLGKTKHRDAPTILVGLLSKNSWAEVVRAAALDALATLGHEPSLKHLLKWSEYGKALRVRRAAISALPKISDSHEVRRHLVDLLEDRDPHTRSAVLSALETLGDERARSAIEELLERELDGRVIRRARQTLSKLGKAGSAGLREMREKNVQLERELAELKTRLSRLEQLQRLPPKKAASKKAASKKTASKKRGAKR